jgi:IMP dehydrogenase
MARILPDISRTFDEYLLLPSLTRQEHIPSNVTLTVPLAKYKEGEATRASLRIPFVAAAMQSVSGPQLAIALARKGGCAFTFSSQSISAHAAAVRRVKDHKAGFVESTSNLPPTATLYDALQLRKQSGHSTIPVTERGERRSKLLGLLSSKDIWESKDDLTLSVTKNFTPIEKLIVGYEGISLQDATNLLWQHKKECLPIVDAHGNLHSLVFRRDYFDHKSNPDELTDARKRLFVGAALNTHDYRERAAAVLEAGADVLCIDSSDGHSEWQKEAVGYLRNEWGESIIIGGGNVVTKEGFDYLVRVAKVDFVKIGIGGGSICITRGQKGIGRGQASAVLEVAEARNEYYRETGIYVPLCSDGGINQDRHITMALAMGADFVMMGKYFASTDESPTTKVSIRGRFYKSHWGEGSHVARNWERYAQSDSKKLVFEEGVDAYVPYSGSLADKVDITISKVKSTMCNLGSLSVKELQANATLVQVSEITLQEGGTSNVEQFDTHPSSS